MGLFDRFRRSSADNDVKNDSADAADDAVDTAAEQADAHAADGTAADEPPVEDDEFAKEAPRDRLENGPWDASEDAADGNRIDLGALRVPVLDGMQVQLEADEKTNRVMAVTMVHKGGNLQIQAFAAPKTEGLWGNVRAQISENITKTGGTAKELYTEIGHELSATMPVKLPDGKVGARPVRFFGVDGPRWFLRGVMTNAAVTDEKVRAELLDIFRGVIVSRGDEPMPPREVLTLTPPTMPGAGEETQRQDDDINPFERGPEITEVR